MTGFAPAPDWWRTLNRSAIEAEVRDLVTNHLAVPEISTHDLVELLWPEVNVRGTEQSAARLRLYRVIMAMARTRLRDCCHQIEEPNKWGGRPYRWHAPGKVSGKIGQLQKAAQAVIDAYYGGLVMAGQIEHLQEAIK